MTFQKSAKEINDEIRLKRVRKGKFQCRIYGILSILMSVIASALTGKVLLVPVAVFVSAWLIFGVSFSKWLYIIGSAAYGIYVLRIACVEMPTRERPGFPLVFMLIFALYIAVSVVRISGSEAVSAYLYEKNAY